MSALIRGVTVRGTALLGFVSLKKEPAGGNAVTFAEFGESATEE